jgi:hypothetical protein
MRRERLPGGASGLGGRDGASRFVGAETGYGTETLTRGRIDDDDRFGVACRDPFAADEGALDQQSVIGQLKCDDILPCRRIKPCR